MNELELVAPAADILDPRTGELLDPADTVRVADLLVYLRELRATISAGVSACSQALIAEAERQGTKTLRAGGTTLEIRGGTEIVWDLEVLRELTGLGLPEERYGDLVKETVTYKVNAAVAKQIAGANPAYADVIERARSDFEKARYVSVK